MQHILRPPNRLPASHAYATINAADDPRHWTSSNLCRCLIDPPQRKNCWVIFWRRPNPFLTTAPYSSHTMLVEWPVPTLDKQFAGQGLTGEASFRRSLFAFRLYEGWSKSFEPGYFRLHFWAKNVTGLSSRLLLVFLKNYMSSACLLY